MKLPNGFLEWAGRGVMRVFSRTGDDAVRFVADGSDGQDDGTMQLIIIAVLIVAACAIAWKVFGKS